MIKKFLLLHTYYLGITVLYVTIVGPMNISKISEGM